MSRAHLRLRAVALVVPALVVAMLLVAARHPAVARAATTPPGPLHVSGNHLVTADGTTFTVHGVARPSLEWACAGQALDGAPGIPASDFATMAEGWKANTVRLALNQDFWLSATGARVAPKESCPGYITTVKKAVADAEAAGLAVVLDLHWSDEGNLRSTDVGQKCMADSNSVTFWKSVAATFAHDPSVLFELYNEPHDISWSVWRNGGRVTCTDGVRFKAAGMQQLVDAVRGAGAPNVVVAGGLDWAYDLSGVAAAPLTGRDIAYATHPYEFKSGDDPAVWDVKFGRLATTYPVIATEFGSTASTVTAYDTDVLTYFRDHGIGYTAWAWWAGGPSFPSLVSDAAGDCFLGGCDVRADLQAYAAGATTTVPQATGVQDSFEDGTDGWAPAWGQVSTAATGSPTYTGTGALAVGLPGGGYPAVSTTTGLTALGPGSTVTMHVYAPSGLAGVTVEPWTEDGAWTVHKAAGVRLSAGWNTVTFGVAPQTGLNALGLQVDDPPAGTLTVDDVAWTAAPAHLDGFEDGTDGWAPAWGTVTAGLVSSPTWSGTGALSVAAPGGYPAVSTRTGLSGLASGTPVTLHVHASSPVTVEPWTEDGSWTVHKAPGAALSAGWNVVTFTVPAETGLNALGLQVDAGSSAANVVVDDVAW